MHNLITVPSQHTVLMKLVMSAEGFHKNIVSQFWHFSLSIYFNTKLRTAFIIFSSGH